MEHEQLERVTVKQAAAELNMDYRTVQYLMSAGRLPIGHFFLVIQKGIYMKIRNILQFFANPNTQTTGTSSLSAENKTFYEKELIEEASPELVHDQFGDDYPIPKNGGKQIEFRKYDSLKPANTPLTEGVTPDGNSLSVSTVTSTVKQYGDYITISDVLDLTAIDNNVVQASKILGAQAGLTLDNVTRDVIAGGTNVLIVGNRATRDV